jgi:prepilin-type N-terminal cleavage/methylation domain-containing protein
MLIRARPRRGLTLVELLVALVVAGVVFALVATISAREQRLVGDIAADASLDQQLREGASVFPIDVRGAAPGDIREAGDSSIELRTTIASAVVCDTSGGALVLPPATAGATATASTSSSIAAGDTAWLFTPGDSIDDWQPHAIIGTVASSTGPCAPGGPALDPGTRALARKAIRLGVAPPRAAIGMPLRVTRPLRFSLYRSGGGWYLGARDWNTTSGRFNTIQPVSGPFLSAASAGPMLEYVDNAGVRLTTPVSDPKRIALIRIVLRGQTKTIMRALGAGATNQKRSDSAVVAVMLRNRD